MIRLTGKLPKSDQDNGMDVIYGDLCDPQRRRAYLVVAVVETQEVTFRRDEADAVPKVRVRRVEVISDVADRETVMSAFMAANSARMGSEQLDLDAEMRALDEGLPSEDER